MVDTKNVTLSQFELMKHALGIERSKIKRGKYIAYRNYFIAQVKIWSGNSL